MLYDVFPSPGKLPDPGIKPTSLVSPALADGFFTTAPSGKPPIIGCVEVAQSCPALCDPMDYTVHGILQPRILE